MHSTAKAVPLCSHLRCHSWRERGDTGRQRGTPGNNERRIGEGKPGAPARGVSLSPTTTTSKIQLIRSVGSVIGKRFDTSSASSPTTRHKTQKRIISANEFLGEMPIFGLCLSGNTKYISRIGTLSKADFRSVATHFGFGCPYRFFVRDSCL